MNNQLEMISPAHLAVTQTPALVGLTFANNDPVSPWVITGAKADGPFQRGIVLENLWNCVLTDPHVFSRVDLAQYQNPTELEVGIDIGTSMDLHIVRPRIMGAQIGIRTGAAIPFEGGPRAEGLHIEGGWMQHVGIGIQHRGGLGGGWPCPASWIQHMHLNFLQVAIRMDQCSGVHINANDIYASHFAQTQWGIVLANCVNVEISNNHFWTNRPGFYGGIALANCRNVHVSGGVLDDALTLAIWDISGNVNITAEGATWRRAKAAGKVVGNVSVS